jgi:hypothetical protein
VPIYRRMQSILILTLSALFFLLAAAAALMSSGVYRSVAARGDSHFAHRTSLYYIENQIRAADTAGGIGVGRFGDGDALWLADGDYCTVLYCYDGSLMELYMEKDLGLGPESGTAILPLEAMAVSAEAGLLRLGVTTDAGEHWQFELYPRGGVSEVLL